MTIKKFGTQAGGKICSCINCSREQTGGGKRLYLSRRGFLCSAFAGAAVALAGAASVRPAFAQSSLTPDEALKELMDGNQRYLSGQLQSLNEDLEILKTKTAEKQEPFAALLSCADSRVPVEFVFDQSIGELFVVRIAGNIATPEIIASLEYGSWAPRSSWCWGTAIAARSRLPSRARRFPARLALFTPPSGRR
jgi:carbonic anhydrase